MGPRGGRRECIAAAQHTSLDWKFEGNELTWLVVKMNGPVRDERVCLYVVRFGRDFDAANLDWPIRTNAGILGRGNPFGRADGAVYGAGKGRRLGNWR